MRALLLAALVALVLIPAAQARPPSLPDVEPDVCDRDPCYSYSVTGSGTSNEQRVCIHVANGACVWARESPESTGVGYGVGITNCNYGIGPGWRNGCVY